MLLLLLACASPAPEAPEAATPDPLEVVTLSLPVDWLTRRLVGEAGAVRCVAPPGEDPPDWQPPGELVASLAEADLIVANGAGYEAWTATASLPESRLVVSATGLDLVVLEGETHSHGRQGEHSHAGVDPHTWSDPALFARQAEAIRDALVRARPDDAPGFEARFDALEGELQQLDQDLRASLVGAKGLPLVASHPAFNYLARRYGLTLRSLDLDPETPPSEAQLAALGEGRLLLWEAAPADAAKAPFHPDVQHVFVDPLEQAPEGGAYDYAAQVRANVATFTRLFPADG